MTDTERFTLLVAVMGQSDLCPLRDERIPPGTPMSAGYVPGIPRLGVPALRMSDAGLGVTNSGYRPGDTATALLAGLALTRLVRDPRTGRNFEYLSEDPLLTATIVAESVHGIQQQGVISTVKHYSLNCNETNRHWLNAVIDPDVHRESDLLAFKLAIDAPSPVR